MKTRFQYSLVFAIILASCASPSVSTPIVSPPTEQIIPTDAPIPTFAPVCISQEPTQADVDRALEYTGDIFNSSQWEQTYTTSEDRVSVTWQNVPEVAVVFLQAIIFPCGHEEPDLNKYFSDENWQLIFQNYESYALTVECKTNDGLRLYEFDAFSDAINYKIKYWVESDTDNRVITTMIAFPLGAESQLDAYASMLFADLPHCS